jgi:DnaJ-class molecular chaperone
MLPCDECRKTGFETCTECSGLGHVHELRGSGEAEYRACAGCKGRKWTPCQACGGIGWLGADTVVPFEAGETAADEEWTGAHQVDNTRDPGALERLVSGDW